MTTGNALRRTVRISNQRGLHARASAKFVQTADQFDADILVARNGVESCGVSIMGLMMLGAAIGEDIDISATGNQAQEALDALVALVENKFGEGE